MLLRQEVERRKLAIIRKLLGLGLAEINGQTLDQLTLTQLKESYCKLAGIGGEKQCQSN